MRKLAILVVAVAIIGCGPEKPKMPGAYRMISQNIKGDTLDITNTNPQLKIYTNEYMMYSSYNPKDSTSSFGIGTFTNADAGVSEIVVYSAYDSTSNSTAVNYNLAIEKTEKGYKQVITDMEDDGQKFTLTEEYESVGKTASSPLDGAWINTSVKRITGTDTTTQEGTQYKTYFAGNFMFAHTYLDSLQKTHTGMGFGTFEMKGENASTENVQTSTYPGAVSTFELALSFNGENEYTQTITSANGNKEVEVYKRLGK